MQYPQLEKVGYRAPKGAWKISERMEVSVVDPTIQTIEDSEPKAEP